MEFFNPGPLPKGMKMQDILSGRLASNPRNKQIASIFKEAGIIEKYGSGIKRVMQSMADAGSPAPVFETIADNFKVTLFPMGEIPGGGVSGGVSGGVNNLLDFIKALISLVQNKN
jgi:ATP-dependent DNA helicase RecG